MAKKSPSANKKARYSTYESRSNYSKNKKAKLERHLKRFPDDKVAQQALANISVTPKRAKAKSRGGLTDTQKQLAKWDRQLRALHRTILIAGGAYTEGQKIYLWADGVAIRAEEETQKRIKKAAAALAK